MNVDGGRGGGSESISIECLLLFATDRRPSRTEEVNTKRKRRSAGGRGRSQACGV